MITIENINHMNSLVSSIQKMKTKIHLWQEIDKTHSYDFAVIESVDSYKRRIRLRLPKIESINFDDDSELFFHSSFREVVFKAKLCKIHQGCVEIEFPPYLKMKDSRTELRTSLGIKSYHYIKISYLNQFQEKIDIKSKILDFSQSGISIIVNKFTFNSLRVGSEVIVNSSSLGDQNNNRFFIVRNKGDLINKIGFSNEYRVGLELVD